MPMPAQCSRLPHLRCSVEVRVPLCQVRGEDSEEPAAEEHGRRCRGAPREQQLAEVEGQRVAVVGGRGQQPLLHDHLPQSRQAGSVHRRYRACVRHHIALAVVAGAGTLAVPAVAPARPRLRAEPRREEGHGREPAGVDAGGDGGGRAEGPGHAGEVRAIEESPGCLGGVRALAHVGDELQWGSVLGAQGGE